MLTIRLAIEDMATSYSQQLSINMCDWFNEKFVNWTLLTEDHIKSDLHENILIMNLICPIKKALTLIIQLQFLRKQLIQVRSTTPISYLEDMNSFLSVHRNSLIYLNVFIYILRHSSTRIILDSTFFHLIFGISYFFYTVWKFSKSLHVYYNSPHHDKSITESKIVFVQSIIGIQYLKTRDMSGSRLKIQDLADIRGMDQLMVYTSYENNYFPFAFFLLSVLSIDDHEDV